MLISVTWLSGLAWPSWVRLLPRSNQLSPMTPNVVSSSAEFDELALVDGRPTGDQLESPAITRGGPHVGKERLEVAIARGVHRSASVADWGNLLTPSSDDDLDDVAIGDLVVRPTRWPSKRADGPHTRLR